MWYRASGDKIRARTAPPLLAVVVVVSPAGIIGSGGRQNRRSLDLVVRFVFYQLLRAVEFLHCECVFVCGFVICSCVCVRG